MRVILPGSYDPVTLGHLDIIRRAAEEYSEVLAVAFINPEKRYTFSVEERIDMLKIATRDIPNVTVDYSDGLVVDYMREHNVGLIVKGYRTEADLPWERRQAEWNEERGYKTRLIKCSPEMEGISSTAAREAISRKDGAAIGELLPEAVALYIEGKVSAKD